MKPKKLIIALDFDGTVVTHAYPGIGRDVGAVPWLRHLCTHGCRIVLFTMRSGVALRDATDWFEIHGIELYGVQTNPGQARWTSSPKAYAHIYVDDAALGAPLVHGAERAYLDWAVAGPMLCELVGIESLDLETNQE
jgi:hypothetical protein